MQYSRNLKQSIDIENTILYISEQSKLKCKADPSVRGGGWGLRFEVRG